MKVYRLEDEEGLGPYQSKMNTPTDSDRDQSDDHPCPTKDFVGPYYEYHFGFNSMYRLNQWFKTFEGSLKEFFVVGYEVDNKFVQIGKSKRQLIFNKTYAKQFGKEKYNDNNRSN